MLTDTQRRALDQSIYDYLAIYHPSVAVTLASATPDTVTIPAADAPPPPPGPTLLEKKWSSVLRLQKKVLDLEAQMKKIGVGMNGGGALHAGKMLPAFDQPPKPSRGHRGGGITAVSIHPTHNTIATSGEDGTVKIWEWETGEFLQTLKGHTSGVQDVSYSGSGHLLASSSADLTIKLWDPEKNYQCVKTLRGHSHNISRVRFIAPGDEFLVSCSRDNSVKFWEASTGFCTGTVEEHEGWVRALAVKCDGAEFASGGNDSYINVYDTKTKKVTQTLSGHDHIVTSLAYPPLPPESKSPDPATLNLLVSTSRDKTVRLWDTHTGTNLHTFTDHDNWVRDVLVHRSRNYAISVSDDKAIVIWDLKNKRKLRRCDDAHGHFITSIAMHPSRMILCTGGVDNTLNSWVVK